MKVTKLVEYVVVGQQTLRRDRAYALITYDNEGVGDVLGPRTREHSRDVATIRGRGERQTACAFAHDRADQQRRHVVRRAQLGQRGVSGDDETLAQQKVLGWVAQQGKFGGEHQVGAD